MLFKEDSMIKLYVALKMDRLEEKIVMQFSPDPTTGSGEIIFSEPSKITACSVLLMALLSP